MTKEKFFEIIDKVTTEKDVSFETIITALSFGFYKTGRMFKEDASNAEKKEHWELYRELYRKYTDISEFIDEIK